MKRPPFKTMTHLVLCGGPNDRLELDIAPTMKNLTHAGESYFRMNSWHTREDGSVGGLYLWTRYWDRDQIDKRKAEESEQ